MPRVTKENEHFKLTYGIDRIEGNFIKVIDKREPPEEAEVHFECCVPISTIIEVGEEYGFNMEDEKDTGDGFEGSGCGGGCEVCVRYGI